MQIFNTFLQPSPLILFRIQPHDGCELFQREKSNSEMSCSLTRRKKNLLCCRLSLKNKSCYLKMLILVALIAKKSQHSKGKNFPHEPWL